jgi:tight adherence protein C
LVLFLTIAVFLATVFGVLAFYWLIASREESLPQRLKDIATSSSGKRTGWGGKGIGERFGEALESLKRKERIKDEIVAMVTSEQLAGTRMTLSQAGFRHRAAHKVYFWVRAILPILLFFFAMIYGKGKGLPNQKVFLLLFMATLFGYLLPIAFVRWKVGKRKGEITDALPDALDLMVVCVEAGLGLNAAFVKISEEFRLSSPTLSEEFDIVNREMVAGKPRQEALRALTDRTGVEEVKSLVAMLIQTEKLGTSLAQSLRVHSDSLRTKRRQRAEEAAAKTTIKLVFPLVFLLFPALFVVILGPGFIQIAKVLFPVMTGNR